MSDYSGSDEKSGVESVEEGTWGVASSSSDSEEAEEEIGIDNTEIDVVARRGADVSLNIHEQLDLAKLQQIKDIFFANGGSDAAPELDLRQFNFALRTVLHDTEDMTDEDLGVLFMKIDANGSGSVDWDEFTGFLLQLDEGNRNMAAAAHMVDLRRLPGCTQIQRAGKTAAQHKGMVEKVINVERPGISAYVTCGRDGTIRFWHKGTFAHLRSINHLDTIKTACGALMQGSQGWDGEGGARCASTAPARRALNAMKSAWVNDIQQMPLGNRLAAACLDRSVSFYEMLTGEFVCRIAGLSSVPTCVECVQVNPNEQLVLFGDLEGVLHLWSFGRHFFIPGPLDAGEAVDLRGNDSLKVHHEAVSCLSYVPDLNAAATCGMDGKVHFIDVAKRRILRTFGGHGVRAVFSLCYCQQHRFVASAGMGREVVFWNPYTMHVLARVNGHASTVKHCLIDDRSGRIITVSTDKAVRCWDSATLRCIQSFKDNHLHRPEDTITAALWDNSKSSLILVGSDMCVWKNKGALQTTTRSHEATVTTALYNKHFHQVVSGDVMGNVQVWLVETGQLAFRFARAHGDSKISCMCFDASERRLLTGADDGTVKMWNFSNGKVLREFGPSAKPGRKTKGSDLSGMVYCRDYRGGSDQVRVEYIATSSWDRLVRVFSDDDSSESGFRPAHASWDEEPRPPSRVFPSRRGGGGGGLEGHSADILAIAHCGHQQVATGGFDGQIFIWAADSGKVRFSMRPSDHDTSKGVDDVSSIGGFTSVARLMERQRKAGLMTEDGDSVDSGGYLERMEDLLADDQSASKPVWDGREFFAEERIGGNDDGSGTAAAAEIPAPGHENADADGSAAGEHENEAAAAGDVVSSSPGGGGGVGVKTSKKRGEGTKGNDEHSATAAAAAAAATNPEGEKVVAEKYPPPEPSTTFAMAENNTGRDTSESPGGDGGGPSSYVGEGNAANRKAGGSIQRSLSSRSIAHGPVVGLTDAVAVIDEEQERSSKQEKTKNGGSGGEELKRSPEVGGRGDVRGARGGQGAGKSATRKLDSVDSVVLKTDDPKANAIAADSAVARLENAASHTVDCLLFIRCHGMLVSGTASGELHFWDTATGALIFGSKAQHPNNAGISAMSSSEGGTVGSEDAGSIVCPDAATAAVEIANLALYTACEEGYVKTWKLGDVSEHLYQTGKRARPKLERTRLLGRGGRPPQSRAAGTASAAGMGTETGNTSATRRQTAPVAADFAAHPGGPNANIASNRGPMTGLGLGLGLGHKVLLVPLRQWRAHETTVSSVGGANYRGKADLLVTAGLDCYVHLWTVAGAFVGTFGQPRGLWSLGSRATWRESADQALLNAQGFFSEADDQTTTVGEEQSAARTERGERRLQGKDARSTAQPTSGSSGGGASPPRRYRMSDARSKTDIELALKREKEETRRYEEQRYYLASPNRVQRKLLRIGLGAFWMSRDYGKQELLQEASSILRETAKKNTAYPAGGSRPGISKNRIASILRNTYNQVSFQLRLHQDVDINQMAEGTLAMRRSRRRQKQQQANNTPTTTATNAANRQGHQLPATASPSAGLDTPFTAPTTPAGTQSNSSSSKNGVGKNGAANRTSISELSPVAVTAVGGEAGGASARKPRRPGGRGSPDKPCGAGSSDPIAIEEGDSTGGGGREDLGGGGRGPKDAGRVRPATAVPSRPALPGSSGSAGCTSFRRLSAAGSGGSREDQEQSFAPLT